MVKPHVSRVEMDGVNYGFGPRDSHIQMLNRSMAGWEHAYLTFAKLTRHSRPRGSVPFEDVQCPKGSSPFLQGRRILGWR